MEASVLMFVSNFISRLFGCFARTRFYRPLQNLINRAYVHLYNVDLSEFSSVDKYDSLNSLFTRRLLQPREFDISQSTIISPCDAVIMSCGDVQRDMALQIKGMQYRVSELIDDDVIDGLGFVNLYLSPRDYHRFHAPFDMEVLQSKYIGGKLLPVNEASLIKNKYLFLLNERVVLKVRCAGQISYYVAIGALNVGKISILHDARIQTNAKLGSSTYEYEKPIFIKKGAEVGTFEMGSTIVLFSSMDLAVKTGDRVKMGEVIANAL